MPVLVVARRAAALPRSSRLRRRRRRRLAQFLSRYDFHLSAPRSGERRRRASRGTRTAAATSTWSTTSSAARRSVADYEAVLGNELRPFDPNQGNLHARGVGLGPRRRRPKSPACFHHVSRHLSDRPKRLRDRLERAGRARAAPVRPTAARPSICAARREASSRTRTSTTRGRRTSTSIVRRPSERRRRRCSAARAASSSASTPSRAGATPAAAASRAACGSTAGGAALELFARLRAASIDADPLDRQPRSGHSPGSGSSTDRASSGR